MDFNQEAAHFTANLAKGKAWYASHQFYAGVIVGLLAVVLVNIVMFVTK